MSKGFIGKVPSPGLASMSVSPSPTLPMKVATFTPETKGRPASVRVHQFPAVAGGAAKTFYNAQEVTLDWSPNGQAVLVKTHTDVDKTGSSYYGSTGLYLLHADGSYETGVALPKEGPISDAKWSPNSRGFVVVSGTMPAVATLFDMRAAPVFSFGSAHRSVASWSPHGRFLCLAGFGNLAGDMDFWDVNKQKRMGSANSHCAVSYGWSPCGRFFMTATCAPRMNVDNCVKLFRYTGAKLLELPHEQLFDARWRPASSGVYADRPQSPTRVKDDGGAAAAAPPKAQAYRPPGMIRAGGGSLAAMMRAERAGSSTGAGKVPTAAAVGAARAAAQQKHLPVGYAPPKESNNAKNKAKKDKKKAADAAAAAAAAEMDKLRVKTEAEAAAAPPPAPAEPEPVDKEKRLKKLNKQLKAIEAIKEKAAAGAALNDDQNAKLGTEAAVKAEIAELEAAT